MTDITFLRSLSPLGRDILNLYLNFLVRAIIPVNQDADAFYRVHAGAIEDAAAMLRDRFGVPSGTLWRGILLDSSDVGTDGLLYPMPTITYLSFSENRAIAEEFANPQSWISTLVRLQRPSVHGYLIEHRADASEVLFSHHWIEPLGLNQMRIPDWSANSVARQCEVILRQKGRRFQVNAINQYSGNRDTCRNG